MRWAMRKSGVDEWLVQAVMGLYSGARTMVRTFASDSRSSEHQGSEWSPLLFSIVTDAITKEARSRLHWELLKVNVGKTILMGGRGEVVSELGTWSCGVCSMGLAANSLQYTSSYIKRIHRRCCAVKCSLEAAMRNRARFATSGST